MFLNFLSLDLNCYFSQPIQLQSSFLIIDWKGSFNQARISHFCFCFIFLGTGCLHYFISLPQCFILPHSSPQYSVSLGSKVFSFSKVLMLILCKRAWSPSTTCEIRLMKSDSHTSAGQGLVPWICFHWCYISDQDMLLKWTFSSSQLQCGKTGKLESTL